MIASPKTARILIAAFLAAILPAVACAAASAPAASEAAADPQKKKTADEKNPRPSTRWASSP
ncbi:MAG: hypothetical protein M0C28_12155 [Candidatus Moduliflexus flocculans]|nr:hypothetical protein [Candidatus Moduliflexus flocculans]